MVGVAGRSRGCLTCRSRRKGCDKQRPICGQCKKGNLECKGYQDLPIIQYHHHGSGSTRYLLAEAPTSPNVDTASWLAVSSNILPARRELDIFDAYRGVLFPETDDTGLQGLNSNYAISAVFEIGDRYLDESLLIKTSVQALAYNAVGRSHDDAYFKKSALQAYGIALRHVNDALKSPERCKNDSVLASCKILGAFEAESGGGANWERHTLGTEQLLILRGPEAHTTGLAHSLFLDARLHVTMVGVINRRQTVLANHEWLTIPFENHPKDLRQRLLDVMLKLPTALNEWDRIVAVKGTPEDTHQRRLCFLNTCFQLHLDLETWILELQTVLGKNTYNAIRDGISQTTRLKHFSMAYTISIYWTCQVILNSTILLAFLDLPTVDSAIDPSALSTWCSAEPYAIKIARSVPYFFQPGAGSFPSAMFAFPMGVAMNYFAYGSKAKHQEYLMFLQAFSTGKPGATIEEFLHNLQDSKSGLILFEESKQ